MDSPRPQGVSLGKPRSIDLTTDAAGLDALANPGAARLRAKVFRLMGSGDDRRVNASPTTGSFAAIDLGGNSNGAATVGGTSYG